MKVNGRAVVNATQYVIVPRKRMMDFIEQYEWMLKLLTELRPVLAHVQAELRQVREEMRLYTPLTADDVTVHE